MEHYVLLNTLRQVISETGVFRGNLLHRYGYLSLAIPRWVGAASE